MGRAEKLQEAQEVLFEKLRDRIVKFEKDNEKGELKVTLRDGVRIYIVYNEYDEGCRHQQ